MSFTQLHIHDLYSNLDGIATSADYVKIAQQYNHPALATTNHGKLNGIYQHYKSCQKGGIKPIIGIEMYVNPSLITITDGRRKRTKDQHVILLVKNQKGYENLLKLNYLSMKDDTHFYYSPRITIEELLQNSDGLYCGTACIGSPFGYLLRTGDEDGAHRLFTSFLDVFKDRFYAEIQLNELTNKMDGLIEGQKTYNAWIVEKAHDYGVPIVLTGDVHYAEQGHDKLQTLSIAIRDKSTIDKLAFELESKNLYYHDIADYMRFNKEFGYNYDEAFLFECYNNTGMIADKVDFKMPERTKMILPKISDDDEMLLIQKAKEGLSRYFNTSFENCPEDYRRRLLTELQVIIRKGFCNYLLILEDIFRFAKEKELSHGPGRGSASGSLVVFCLGITTIDPIRYGLLFERFINQARMSDYVYNYWADDKEAI